MYYHVTNLVLWSKIIEIGRGQFFARTLIIGVTLIREQTVQNVHYRGFNWNLERIIEQVFAQMGKFPKALEFILSSHKKRLADK